MSETTLKTNSIDWKWVFVGALVIVLLNQLFSVVLLLPLALPLIKTLGLFAGLIAATIVVALLSYFLGSMLVAYISAGETILEPALGCSLAIVVNLVLTATKTGKFSFGLAQVLALSVSFLLGIAGAKMGEKLQGDTETKRIARGESPA